MTDAPPTTVEEFLGALPDDRRDTIEAVRQVVLDSLPEGYVEEVAWGMLAYRVPLERSGPTYNGQPLMYAALAVQKRHYALYLTSVYADPDELERFRERYLASGRKLDMGKSCVRFRELDDLPLDVVAATIGSTTVDEFLAAAAR